MNRGIEFVDYRDAASRKDIGNEWKQLQELAGTVTFAPEWHRSGQSLMPKPNHRPFLAWKYFHGTDPDVDPADFPIELLNQIRVVNVTAQG